MKVIFSFNLEFLRAEMGVWGTVKTVGDRGADFRDEHDARFFKGRWTTR